MGFPRSFFPERIEAGPAALSVAELIELFPVPALVLGEEWRIVAFNGLFHTSGLDQGAELHALEAELARRVVHAPAEDIEFGWTIGDVIDSRHYRVRLARHGGQWLVSLIDHTQLRRSEESLQREMATDSLTGLLNRAGFDQRIEQAIDTGEVERSGYAVMVVDLQRFSQINACLGALAGDELLITLARRLEGALRQRDLLGRTGGDEFGILLTLDDGPGDALHVARRIEAALASPFRLSGFEIRVSCAIGIAYGANETDGAQELIRHAQFALKRAKASGRIEVYQPHAFELAREAFGLETELRRAIESGSMRLAFQPIWDLATGRIVSVEALARWTDRNGVEQPPADFIPVAEESGLIVPLGRWAIEAATRTLADWDERSGGNCGIGVSVNLSAIQLQRDRVAPIVEAALAASGLAGERLTLELTESALITDPERTARSLHALRALGTTLSMDDFGTGYSNLAYLQKLPIDQLKIDRSLVTDMLVDRDKVAIVRAILSLAQALGMGTTAEGVETNELAQTLAALGCRCGQGFLVSRALEADQAWAFIDSRRH